MISTGTIRNWATPITIGAFILLAVTGVLMFFHLATGLNKEAHEWLSWILIAGVAAHLYANMPSFKFHLKSTRGRVLIGMFVVILTASFFIKEEDEGGFSPRVAMDILSDAPIATLATLTKTDTDSLLRKMQAQGISNADAQTSVHALANGNRRQEKEIMSVVFARP